MNVRKEMSAGKAGILDGDEICKICQRKKAETSGTSSTVVLRVSKTSSPVRGYTK